MSAFTKGPWVVRSDGNYPHIWVDFSPPHCMNICGPVHGYMYAEKWGMTQKENQYANAHLIAASPDMYKALENLVGWQIAIECVCPELGGLLNAIYQAKAALAKARGEQ